MSDIFISYSSKDREKARKIAKALEAQGWSVWWDRKIPPGKSFDKVIEEELDASKCVVVLWSKASVGSDWVKTEAAEGKQRGMLFPVLIDDVAAKVPLEFKRIQAVDLVTWEKDKPHPEFTNLLNAISEVLGPPPVPIPGIPKPVKEPKVKAEPARKETERRQATVLCGEIFGYNEMLEKLGVEEAASIMNNCFEMVGTIVEKYGGTIDKIMGSNLTAFFGLPTAIENAARKAVNTALEIRTQLYQLNQEKNLPIPLDIHVGIDTGMVIAGEIGTGTEEKRDYAVMGDTVILASQLKELSEKGQIYIGPLTYRYTKHEFDYKELKPITLEGKTKPVTVFELLSTKEKMYRPELGLDRMIDSEMVGREKELDKLKLHVLKVINGEGSIVSVIGEAGIGKSRLIDELKKIEDIKKVTLLEGRGLSIGKNLGYHPIIDMLKGWAKIKEEDSESESLSNLETAIANIYPDHEGAAEVFPFVATLMGMKLTGKYAERVKGIEGEALERLILKNMKDLMIKLAEHRPTVCILHDIHWADISSIELFESLFRLAENHGILFINALRPDYQETGERVLETIRERYVTVHTEIYLEPLDDKQCEILIQNLVKVSGLPTEIMDAISKRAEGNPFFIEEVVRSFIDEGVVELRDGKFNVTEKVDSVVIPETIQDVLMARIDRLDEATRTLLKEASVIGRYFFYKILVEVAKSIEDIDERLEYLKGIQLIQERVRLEEIEYLFKHTMAQEVTYESILQKERKELHLDVAAAIESVFFVKLHEFYGMLALHYSRGENLEKAEEYLIKAGEEALKAAASSEALNYYQEAMIFYLKKSGDAADPEKIAMLEKNIALALFNKGHYVEAVKHIDNVLKCWKERRPGSKYLEMLILIGNLLYILKHLYFPSKKAKKTPKERDNEIINLNEKRAIPLAHMDTKRFFMESIRILKRLFKLDITKVENGASIFTEGSIIFSFTGISFKISKKILDHAKNFINKNDLKSLLCFKYTEIMHNYLSGNWRNQPEYDEHVVDRKLSVGDVFHTGGYTFFSGFLKIEQGNFNDAHVLADKLYEIGELYDNDQARGRKYLLNTRLLIRSRKLPDALKEVNTEISLQNIVGINFALCLSGMRPYIQILMKDIHGAEMSLLQLKELISHEEQIVPFYICSFLMGQFLFDLYMLEDAIHSNEKSKISHCRKKAYHSGKAAVKNSMKYAADKTEAFKLMGVYDWLIGRQRKALSWWDKSIKIGEYLGAWPELARTYMEVGKRLMEKKSKFQQLNDIKAEEYLKKARVLFKEMELDWDLEQLDKIKG
jgi:class 3 adenylate cyclase/tetratricopeptide (TPR) repeat protein